METYQEIATQFNAFFQESFNYTSPWRENLRGIFAGQVQLSAQQTDLLLSETQSTSQFRASMKDPNVPNKGNVVGAAFTEPVHKIAQYFMLPNTDEAQQNEILQKAEAICTTLPQNLKIILGKDLPPKVEDVYNRLSDFAHIITAAMEEKGISPTRNIAHFEGMHHMGTLPGDFSTMVDPVAEQALD